MTQREIIRNNLNKSDWEITKDKCDLTRAHRRHLAANRKNENKRKIYCTNVHLRIIEILITLMYNLSAVTSAVTHAHHHTPQQPILRACTTSTMTLTSRSNTQMTLKARANTRRTLIARVNTQMTLTARVDTLFTLTARAKTQKNSQHVPTLKRRSQHPATLK